MKRKIVFVLICLCLCISIFALAGCEESTNQKAIEGDYSNKLISSNGGLALTYGDYLYFVNGYAGQDVDNTFGKVTKGAIYRVELDENNLPKLNTKKVIVPKNVYSSDSEYGGIYIYNDYIYYPTTSMKKDAEGNPKTSEMVVMRTKIDGTESDVIAEFKTHTIKYRINNDSMLYVDGESNLYRIDLTSKKFDAELVEEEISSYFFTKSTDNKNDMDNYIFYTKTNEDTSKAEIKVAAIEGNLNKVIISSELMGDDATYTIKITSINYYQDKLILFYDITDDKVNNTSAGIYAYTYDNTFSFDKANLKRFTNNPTSTSGFGYSNFYIMNDRILAVGSVDSDSSSSSKIDMFSLDGLYIENLVVFNSSVNIYDLYQKDNNIYCYYYASSKFYKIKLYEIVENNITITESNAVLYYDGAFSSSWIPAEVIKGKLYFLNNSISDNIYYLDLDSVQERDVDSRTPNILGHITDADRISAF